MATFTPTPADLPRPPRITVTPDGDALVVKLRASAFIGQTLCLLGIILVPALPIMILTLNGESVGALLSEDGAVALGAYAVFGVALVIQLLMRGYNVTTVRLTADSLTRHVRPFGFGKLALKRESFSRVAVRSQRTSEASREDGIRIWPYEVYTQGETPKDQVTIKSSVRGRSHALYLALCIAHTYDLPSAETLTERLEATRALPAPIRLLAD